MAATRSISDLPGPTGLPLLGNVHQVHAERLHLIGERWCRRYGPIFRFQIGRRQFVGVGDSGEINAILRERPDGYRRWREVRANTEEMFGAVGVFAAEGADWRHQRRLAVTALNSNHLQRYFEVIATCTDRLHRRLSAAASKAASVEIGELLSSFTVDVTSALAFGHDLNTLERGEVELQAHLHRVFEMGSRRLVALVPYWRWLKLPADRALERSLVEIRKSVDSFMEQTRARIVARPELRDEPENFLEGMIAAQEKDGSFSDEEIFANVFTLLLAGEDTTSHTMAWTIWLLASRPEIQARWAEEAAALLGAELWPAEYELVEEFRYGEAVLRESMRLKAVAPVSGVEPLADTEVAGTHIPAGTRLLLLTRLAGLNSVPGGENFDPERWLEEDGDAPDQKAFLAFGAGPRFCPGRNLAFLEAKTAMAMIARNFELELDTSAGAVTELFGFTMSPRGLRVRLRERSPAMAGAG